MKRSIFKNKRIIVTGGTGSIGSEIVRQLLNTDAKQIRVYSRDEHKQYELLNHLPRDPRLSFLIGDIRDRDRTDFAFRGIDICFHAAALKHVPACEYNPFEAVKTNIIGTQNIIDIAIRHNVERVVAISTDKAADPASVLGASKLMMERLIAAANLITGPSQTRFASVRFGNVLNSRGSVLTLWRKQIEEGKNITVTDKNVTRYFMEIPTAVSLVFNAYQQMQGGEIFVLDMGEPKNIYAFAEQFLKENDPTGKLRIQLIGLRPGEKMHETLITEDEMPRTKKINGMYVIAPLDLLGLSELLKSSAKKESLSR